MSVKRNYYDEYEDVEFNVRGVNRDRRKRNSRKMKVSGASVKVIDRITVQRSQEIQKARRGKEIIRDMD